MKMQGVNWASACFGLSLVVVLVVRVDSKVMELKVVTQSKPEECYPHAANGDEVSVHYTGKLENGAIFDSSVLQQRDPIAFTLGAGRVIPGWEQGIVGMCVGEKRLLTIPSHLAYGKQGSPPQIPPDSTLIFETELMSLKTKGQAGIEETIIKTLRLLAMPSLILYIIYYLYKKYQSDTKSASKSTKDKRKKRK